MTNDNMPPPDDRYLSYAVDQLEGKIEDLQQQANNAIVTQNAESLEQVNKMMAVMHHQIATLRREQALMTKGAEAQKQLEANKKAWVYVFLAFAAFKIDGSRQARQGKPIKPPALAECLTRAVTKPKLVDRVLDARAEKFERHIETRGLRRARAFYWIDTFKSCWPALKGLGRWLVAGELVRRWLGS